MGRWSPARKVHLAAKLRQFGRLLIADICRDRRYSAIILVMDAIDRKIIAELQAEGRLTVTELAQRVALSVALPMLNTCMRCPNARRTAVHLPRLAAAREQALELQAACDAAGPVPAPQHAAITGYISDLTKVIDQIDTAPADQDEQR
jgi:AsnC-type helix-turn-helix domain